MTKDMLRCIPIPESGCRWLKVPRWGFRRYHLSDRGRACTGVTVPIKEWLLPNKQGGTAGVDHIRPGDEFAGAFLFPGSRKARRFKR